MRLSPRLHRSFIETRPKSASREPKINVLFITLITGVHLARIKYEGNKIRYRRSGILACTRRYMPSNEGILDFNQVEHTAIPYYVRRYLRRYTLSLRVNDRR